MSIFFFSLKLRGSSGDSAVKAIGRMILIGIAFLFFLTGMLLLLIGLDINVLEYLLDMPDLIIAIFIMPAGALIMYLASIIKPIARLEVHVKYTKMRFIILRRTTIAENYWLGHLKVKRMESLNQAKILFQELPSIARSIN